MKNFPRFLINTLLIGFASAAGLQAQSTITKEDYQRAVSFLWDNLDNQKVFNLGITPHWFSDSTGFWYLSTGRDGKTFRKVTFNPPGKTELFDHERLAKTLSEELGGVVRPDSLLFNSVEYIYMDTLRFKVKEKLYQLDLDTYILEIVQEVKEMERTPNEAVSPDSNWIAYTDSFNLYIRSVDSSVIRQLSFAGRKNYEYASYYGWYDLMEGEGGDRQERFDVTWSPDSRWIQTYICDTRSAQKMYLLDWSVDTLYRPRLLSYYRGSPGYTSMIYMLPVLFNIATGEEVIPDLPRATHINPVSFRWSEDTNLIYANYAERGYQKEYLLKIDLTDGIVTPLFTDSSQTNIDNFAYWLAEKAGKVIVASERSGWRQLYTVDLEDHSIQPIVQGDYYIHDLLYIDQESETLFFTAAGKEEGRNPYHQHLYSASLDGGDPIILTPEDAHHRISFSPDKRYFVDTYSTAAYPERTRLRETKTGELLLEISKADITDLVAMNWSPPELFTAIGRDGQTTIYGALWKPTNFDPEEKYPIIDHSYTGPHTQMFPRYFSRVLSINNQALAELGFVVVMVDGMGTSGRSRSFHDVSYKNMGMNLLDHVLAIRQLAEQYLWIDTTRVGIFGRSAGGYDAAHAMLQFPDFYKVAVSTSADHDFRMEKAWWPEMYMGWPVDSTYHLVSNITMAPNLKGKLLLIHGGLDNNVNGSATFKLAEALIKADKDFDMLIVPSQGHSYKGNYAEYVVKRRWNYFVEHLLGASPIWDFQTK